MDSRILSLAGKLRDKEISSTELTKMYFDEIEKNNSELNAYVHLTREEAFCAADIADAAISDDEKLPILFGLPMTLKDNMAVKGTLTTCCSKILTGHRPIYNCTAWTKLASNGAVLLGKTNMDEFAMGSTCENSCFGGAKNPHNTKCVAGGSSGGVASAVGGHLAVYGLGSDTGGSIRQPASFCGLVGLKPTYGSVSRYGLIAYASSLDQIGPITEYVADAAIVYDAICGYDRFDSTTAKINHEPTMFTLQNGVKGLRIGIADEYFEGINPEIKASLDKAIAFYEKQGAEIVRIKLPILKYALPVYYILACAEASSNLGRYDGIRYGYRTDSYEDVNDMIAKTRSEGFGEEVKRRIMLGTYVLSSGYYDAYYKKAQLLRKDINATFADIFTKCDVILSPTVPNTAFEIGYTSDKVIETYLSDICTVPINIAGLPAISIPCGMDSRQMPIGMQLIGNSFDEKTILRAAFTFEQGNKGCIKKVSRGVAL